MNRLPKTILTALRGIIALLIASTFLQGGCKNNPVEIRPKNPREYTWSIDTIAYPGSFQTSMYDVWGSSASNLYIVGHDDQGLGLMWHYDGAKWTNVKLGASQGGVIDEAMNLTAVYGLAPNNIWAVGMTLDINPQPPPTFLTASLIIHFNGLRWEEEGIERGGTLNSISGCDPRTLWACGSRGTIYRFNGTSWLRDSIPLPIAYNGNQSLVSIKVRSQSEAYALGYSSKVPSETDYYFFARQNDQWIVASTFSFYSGKFENRFGINGLWLSSEGTLYSFDSMVSRWTGSTWIKMYDGSSTLRRVAGTGDSDFFAVGDFGKVLHFNGSNFFEYPQLKNSYVVYSSVWTDGNEVFIVGYLNDGSKTVVLHGK